MKINSKISRHGFTLIELLIALTIIAVMAAVAMMFFRYQASKGNDARRKADINRIKVAVEEYEKDHNCYPEFVTCGVHQTQPIYPYLNNVPCDPVNNASYYYDYQNSSCPRWYRFYSNLEYTEDPAVTPGVGPGSAFNYVSGYAIDPSAILTSDDPNTQSIYYGCKLGICTQINWNPSRPGPVCDPSFRDSNCYNQCGSVGMECIEVL